MPLSEESDPSGKRQKQPCTGATTAAEKAGTTDAQRAAAPAFFFLPAMPGRSHCTACSSQRPPQTTCTGQHPAARPVAYHANAARLPYASIQQTAAPYCTACTLPACSSQLRPPPCRACQIAAAPGLLWGGSLAPAGPARLPDRRRAASCNDPAPAARRRADDHGPPAPRP